MGRKVTNNNRVNVTKKGRILGEKLDTMNKKVSKEKKGQKL